MRRGGTVISTFRVLPINATFMVLAAKHYVGNATALLQIAVGLRPMGESLWDAVTANLA